MYYITHIVPGNERTYVMKKRTIIIPIVAVAIAGGVAATLFLTGKIGPKKTSDKVYVETLSSVMNQNNMLSSVFMGVTESPETTKIKASSERKVEQLLVSLGDFVNEGDILFIYEEGKSADEIVQLQLEIEGYDLGIKAYNKQIADNKKTLEGCYKQLGYLNANISGQIDPENHKMQIAEWQEEIDSINDNIEEINTNIEQIQTSIAQLENNKKATQNKIDIATKKLANTEVTAPVSGTICAINDPESPEYNSNDASFLTIQHVGILRVRGTINEQNIWSISEGDPVLIRSRIDDEKTWIGYISSIDTGSNAENDDNSNSFYGNTNSDFQSSKYTFYMTLEEADGLLLGQHVYIELGSAVSAAEKTGLWLYDFYISYDDAGAAYVWVADNHMRLTKKYITLGDYDMNDMTYNIVDGLTEDSLICYPMDYLYEGVSCVTNYDDVDYSSPMYNQDQDYSDEDLYDDEYFEDGGLGNYVEDEAFADESTEDFPMQ